MTKKTKAAAAAETPASAIGAPTTVLTVTLDQLEHDPIAIDGHEKRLSALAMPNGSSRTPCSNSTSPHWA